jgi:hypothetical protein
MRSLNRRRTVALLAVAPVACLTLGTGCSTYTASASDWRASPPPIRAGIGDSLGNALFLRQIQLAKSVQFQTAPTYATQTQE